MLPIALDGVTYGYVLRPDEAVESPAMDSRILAQIGARMRAFFRYKRHGVLHHFLAEARTARVFEDFPEVIVNLGTAFEVFVRDTRRLVLRHGGVTEAELEQLLDLPFRNVIENQFQKYLGSGFDLKQPGPMKEWFDALYALRNRVVHEGYWDVTPQETTRAFEAFQGGVAFIMERLIASGVLDSRGRTKLSDLWPDDITDADTECLVQRARETGFIPADRETRHLRAGPRVPNLLGPVQGVS